MTVSLIGVAEVDLSDLVVTEEHIELPVCGGWSQRYRIAAQGLTDAKDASTEVQRAVVLRLAHDIAWGVLDVGDLLREGARARLVARYGDLQAEGFMGAFQIVDVPKAVELALTVQEIVKPLVIQYLDREVRWKRSSLPWVCG
jgi:hypothetical protein